jgi:tRNA pseudouridine13 synthase
MASVSIPGLRILDLGRHPHKLRTGHLKGNRFRILVREPKNPEAGREALQRIQRVGLPNYFGPQRFGAAGSNARIGRSLLEREQAPPVKRFERKLFLSSYQSLLFNRALEARIRRGDFSRALPGDVMRRLDSGGLFVCMDPQRDQPRVEAFEISPAGPLFGPKMLRAQGEVAHQEEALLAAEQVTLEDFERGGRESRGGRRPYRIRLSGFELAMEGGDARLSFELPKGTYATVLLRELIR